MNPLKDAPLPISILAPARGATQYIVVDVVPVVFQFPPPRGGRPWSEATYKTALNISIPVPARGGDVQQPR